MVVISIGIVRPQLDFLLKSRPVAIDTTTINILTTMDPSYMVYCFKAENLNMKMFLDKAFELGE